MFMEVTVLQDIFNLFLVSETLLLAFFKIGEYEEDVDIFCHI